MGNVFRAAGEPPVLIRWVDNTHLIIDESEGTEVFFRVIKDGNIDIADH